MKSLRWLRCAAGLVLTLKLAGAASLPFPFAKSDLAPDPAAQFGTLPNGLRWVVYPNHEPRGRASLRLLVMAGSLNETDDQRGLAHYLEHMAFNGSAHYPPGTLIEYFQRLGMSFGGDTNAYTSFDRTVYQIELPTVTPSTIDEGLRVFADMAGTLLLQPDSIVKERPIILSEKRDRDSVEFREEVANFQFLLPDSLIPRRMPIGTRESIERSVRSKFEDLYNTWYRPEKMVIVVVGDLKPEDVAPRIAQAFGVVRDRAPVRPDPDLGQATVALGLKTGYYYDAEAPSTTVSIDVVTPYRPPVDTKALRLGHLKRDLAIAMLNRRLSILSKKENAPFIRAGVAVDESFRFVHDAGINVTCNPAQWRAALAVGEQELRGALTFGFTAAELREASANLRNALTQLAAGAATRRSPELADEIAGSFMDLTVFTSPAQDLALFGAGLNQVTPDDCLQALRLAFGTPGRYVMVEGNARIEGNARAAIAEAYQAARAAVVKPPGGGGPDKFPYTDFGPSGSVVWRQDVKDLGLTELRFANGVRLNLKQTPFEAHRTRIRVRVGAGRLLEPRTQPGLAVFSDLTFESGGLGRLSVDDLQRVLAGKTLGLQFKVGTDALELSGATNETDLPLEFQLLAAYLSDPGYRPEAMRTARKNLTEMYAQLSHSVEGPLQLEIPRLLASGDPRFGFPPAEVAQQRNLDEERAWLAPQLTRGPIEIGVAGDFDPARVIAAAARTFGALPARDPKPPYLAERAVVVPTGKFSQELSVPSQIPKAVVAAYWPTDDARDIRRTRRLNLLAEAFTDRLRVRIREQLGGAYSPEAGSEASDTFDHYGFLVAELVVAPERAAEIEKAIVEVAADMAASGVSADQLDRAKRPTLTALKESARTNQYWLGAVLGSCQEFPQRLEWARTRYSDIESITKAEIDRLAREYLGSGRVFQVIVRPR